MDYGKKHILGLKLRTALQLRKLSRQELFTRLQIIRTVEPVTLRVLQADRGRAVALRR